VDAPAGQSSAGEIVKDALSSRGEACSIGAVYRSILRNCWGRRWILWSLKVFTGTSATRS
jgi:hypothetical protein